ncbi:MAG: hypothetical protein WBF69_09090 [Castellaniella sp.]|uniref:hypothetical protein n=1 Tax=Castellaniella sp. TaxID=1955812 RepID=UPI003C75E050
MQKHQPKHPGQPISPDAPQLRRDEAKTVQEREDALDEALDGTFPASDPVSTTPQPPARSKKS